MKESDSDLTPLENLDRRLNRRQEATSGVRRSTLPPLGSDLPRSWAKEESTAPTWWRRLPWLNISLVLSALFFSTMLAFFGWWLFQGSGRLSVGNIDLLVAGPQTAKAGEPVVLNLTLTNRNNLPLEFADLIIEYPPGAQSVGPNASSLSRERFQLGEVKSGETKKQTVRLALFGEEQTEANLSVSTEYQMQNSNAIFTKTTKYPIVITSAPATLSLVLPETVATGQVMNVKAKIQNESNAVIDQPTVIIHYPPGFKFQKATVAPANGDNERFDLDALQPGEKKEIEITGLFEGEDSEMRTFRGEIGTRYQTDGTLAILYDSDLQSVNVSRAYVALGAKINGVSAAEVIANGKDEFRVDIDWTNTLPDEIKNGQLSVALTGAGFDPETVSVNGGFYRSADQTVNWNGAARPDLALIQPGGTGHVSFSFLAASLLSGGDRAAIKNPTISLQILFQGKRVVPEREGATEPVKAEITRSIKLNSTVELSAQVLHRTGPLENSGPLPPKVGQPTTYTIVWSLANSSNDLSGTTVQATLPLYMSWVGAVTPSNETVQFIPADGGGGQIIWKVGAVRAETGSRYDRREVAFQVSLVPSASQIGQKVVLVESPALSAQDAFTGQKISGEARRALDTYLVSEAGFQVGEDKVVK